MALLGESIYHCVNILNRLAKKNWKKNHAHKTNVLNQRAQRHSNHCSASLETDEYKLSLKKVVFLLIVCTTERINFRLSRGPSFSLPL